MISTRAGTLALSLLRVVDGDADGGGGVDERADVFHRLLPAHAGQQSRALDREALEGDQQQHLPVGQREIEDLPFQSVPRLILAGSQAPIDGRALRATIQQPVHLSLDVIAGLEAHGIAEQRLQASGNPAVAEQAGAAERPCISTQVRQDPWYLLCERLHLFSRCDLGSRVHSQEARRGPVTAG